MQSFDHHLQLNKCATKFCEGWLIWKVQCRQMTIRVARHWTPFLQRTQFGHDNVPMNNHRAQSNAQLIGIWAHSKRIDTSANLFCWFSNAKERAIIKLNGIYPTCSSAIFAVLKNQQIKVSQRHLQKISSTTHEILMRITQWFKEIILFWGATPLVKYTRQESWPDK